MLHFLLEIIIMTRSTKTRLLLRDKCKVVHSDRLYRPHVNALLRDETYTKNDILLWITLYTTITDSVCLYIFAIDG